MKRITITFDDELLEKIDDIAKEKTKSRSSVIKNIIKTYIKGTVPDEEGMKSYAENEYLKERIKDLQYQVGWLQEEHSKLSSLLTQRMLPQKSSFVEKIKFWKSSK